MATEFKKITLCADDFGFNSGVSEGLLKLIRMKRLSAVSCMVNTAVFGSYAEELCSLAGQVQIGLHFNLTEGSWLSNPQRRATSLHSMLLRTHFYGISTPLIERELHAQLDCFMATMGRSPDFIDGHQHVHQFPVVRTALLKVYAERLKAENCSIRSTYPTISHPSFRFKEVVLAHTGGKFLKNKLTQLAIAHNPCFAGIYDFSPALNYRVLFQQWLHLAPANSLIMCHPGEGWDAKDSIAQARANEMSYFCSDEFLDDCTMYKVAI